MSIETLTPEEVVETLRGVSARMGEVTPLTAQQRKRLRNRCGRTTNPILQAGINVIGALDQIERSVGQPAAEVRQLVEEANRWTAVEDELRTMLSGVAGANLIRRERAVRIAAQAAGIGAQLARDPDNAVLLPHLEEIRRLRSFARRKKTAPAPDAPPPDAGTAEE